MFTSKEIKDMIVSQRVLRNVLTVEISVPIKKYVREQKKTLTTEQVVDFISEKYQILEVVKGDQLINWLKKGRSQTGIWKFKIKKETKKTPAKKQPEPEVTQQENSLKLEEEKVIETPKPTPAPKKNTKKPSKTSSFRGRIKNIANNKK